VSRFESIIVAFDWPRPGIERGSASNMSTPPPTRSVTRNDSPPPVIVPVRSTGITSPTGTMPSSVRPSHSVSYSTRMSSMQTATSSASSQSGPGGSEVVQRVVPSSHHSRISWRQA
jgi:hypothetical protein